MESLMFSSSSSPSSINGFLHKHLNFSLVLRNGYSSSLPFSTQNSPFTLRKSVVVAAKKNESNNLKKKENRHGFVVRPDESTGFFPEAVLLKEKKVQEDGTLLPDFADAEEKELYEALTLMVESDRDVGEMRHYEVVYLIHENFKEEVENVNLKVQDFLREKKGVVWRFSDWGLRRLAYKIQKAKNAHYILMNFEIDTKWINDFKSMLDKDERVIRHLVIKRDGPITEACPPPPQLNPLQDDYDDLDDMDYDDEDYDDENDVDIENMDEDEDGPSIIFVDEDEEDEDVPEASKDRQREISSLNGGRRKQKAEKVGR